MYHYVPILFRNALFMFLTKIHTSDTIFFPIFYNILGYLYVYKDINKCKTVQN